jgi:hypothetical protein
MSDDVEDFLKKAREAERAADNATDAWQKAALIDLARQWRQLPQTLCWIPFLNPASATTRRRVKGRKPGSPSSST